MRQIKFRGIYTSGFPKKKNWIYGNLVDARVSGDRLYINRMGSEIRDDDGDFCGWAVDPETIGEYTGLKDVNGKEIYEGDIIHYKSSNGRFDDNMEILFQGGSFVARAYTTLILSEFNTFEGIKIIGNIHENPELLEENDE